MKRPESFQKQVSGPPRFPVPAVEEDRLGKGPLHRREWFFEPSFWAYSAVETFNLSASCIKMTFGVRAETRTILLGHGDPRFGLHKTNRHSLSWLTFRPYPL
jgi:hypothetical protein